MFNKMFFIKIFISSLWGALVGICFLTLGFENASVLWQFWIILLFPIVVQGLILELIAELD